MERISVPVQAYRTHGRPAEWHLALVSRLVEPGILQEVTGYARNRRFRYEPFVRLFTDEVPEEPAGTGPAPAGTSHRSVR